MNNIQIILLSVQIIVTVIMIAAIFLQKSRESNLSGIGGGNSLNSVISNNSSNNAITKFTMVMVAIFMANCLLLAVISDGGSNLDKYIEQEINNKSSSSIPKIID